MDSATKIMLGILGLGLLIAVAVIVTSEEKDPAWSNRMSVEWAHSLGFQWAQTECINYHSNYAKCSVKVDNGKVYAVECLRHKNKCVGGE